MERTQIFRAVIYLFQKILTIRESYLGTVLEEEMSLSIFTGNIGCGKSLLASKLAKMGHVVVNMDTLQQMFAGGEYGAYDKYKKDVYIETENTAIKIALKNDFSVVVDRTNMDRKRRERFINIGKQYANKIISYNWGDGTTANLLRRTNKPKGVPEETWIGVFDYMQKCYEPPSLEEGFDEVIEAPQKFKFYAFDFDGTIVKNKFPKIGEIISGEVERLNKLWEDLSNIIIIWSCRSGDYINQVRAFMIKHKIPFDFINENPIFDTGSRKIFAHEYHDDRNIIVE